MKNPLLIYLSLFLLGTGLLTAAETTDQPVNMATVNMDRLFAEYDKTQDLVREFKKYGKEIQTQRDDKIAEIRKIVKEAEKLKKDAADPTITGEQKRIAFVKSQNKQREVQQRAQMLQQWLRRKQAALVEKQRADSAVLHDELIETVQKVATEEGYDYVFDSSGGSSSGLSVILFTKDAADITGLLLQSINKEIPADDKSAE